MSDVTQLLEAVGRGEPQAMDELLPVVYQELRQMAALQLTREKPGQTLQPTALVHEAWLRLVKPQETPSQLPGVQKGGRRYFFAAAAEAMRRILVDNARRKMTVKHGGATKRQEVELDHQPNEDKGDELLDVHEALDHLSEHDPLKAELVKLRYFAGFTNAEAAELLDLTPKMAEKHWVYARAWLKRHLER